MGTGLSREQLDALRRQIEEDYRLDMAAIERLQRRFMSQAPAANFAPASLSPVNSTIETLGTALPPKMDQPRDPQPDELTGSLRAMFSSQRK
ncbi:MAG TPA: hypothetical protein VMD29_14940 [Terracidiphilus sp.]|jgi:hypothetical protein|nr:hypothetical protein [Terracidiphilus sp.]